MTTNRIARLHVLTRQRRYVASLLPAETPDQLQARAAAMDDLQRRVFARAFCTRHGADVEDIGIDLDDRSTPVPADLITDMIDWELSI